MKEPSITFTIRSAMPSDYERCGMIDHSISTETVWQMLVSTEDDQNITFRPVRLPRSMKVVYPRQGDALAASWNLHNMFLVAEWEQDVVGYISVRQEQSQEVAWVSDMAVDAAYRLRGVGTSLLRAARNWAMDQSLRRMIVETHTKNFPAIQFLKHCGMTFCGYNELYYPNQDIALFFGQTLR